jgi:hypothetical protein
METTITGILYLDMLHEFLIRQLNEDDQEGQIHFQHSLITLEKCCIKNSSNRRRHSSGSLL